MPGPYVTIGSPVRTKSNTTVIARKTAKPYQVARSRATPVAQAAISAPASTTTAASVYSAMGRRLGGAGSRRLGPAGDRFSPSEALEQDDREQGEEREQQRLLGRDPGRDDRDDPVLVAREPAARGPHRVEPEEDDEDRADRTQQTHADHPRQVPAGEEGDAEQRERDGSEVQPGHEMMMLHRRATAGLTPPVRATGACRMATGSGAGGLDVPQRWDDLPAVDLELLLLVPVHEVEVELVDAGLREGAQPLDVLLHRPHQAEAVDDVVGHEARVRRADLRVVQVVVALAIADVLGQLWRQVLARVLAHQVHDVVRHERREPAGPVAPVREVADVGRCRGHHGHLIRVAAGLAGGRADLGDEPA